MALFERWRFALRGSVGAAKDGMAALVVLAREEWSLRLAMFNVLYNKHSEVINQKNIVGKIRILLSLRIDKFID